MSEPSSAAGPSNSPSDVSDNIRKAKITFMARFLNFMQKETRSFAFTPSQKQSLLTTMDKLRAAFQLTDTDMEAQMEHNLLSGILSSPEELRSEAMALAIHNKDLGVAALQELQHDDAAEYFTKSIRAYPNDALVFVNRATAYSRLDRFQDAIADCNTALAMEPNCFEAHHTLGKIYYFLRQLKDSVKEYEEAVRLNPNNEMYRNHLKDARDRYSAYLSMNSKHTDDGSDVPSTALADPPPPRHNRQGDVVPGFPRLEMDDHSDFEDDSDTAGGDRDHDDDDD